MKHHETFCMQLNVPHWGVVRNLCLRANSPHRVSGDITQDKFGHWMRQLLPQSCRTMADSPTHLIKYLMQTLFHAWLSACAVHCSLCVCLCVCVCVGKKRERGCTTIFCHYIALIKSCTLSRCLAFSSLSHTHMQMRPPVFSWLCPLPWAVSLCGALHCGYC